MQIWSAPPIVSDASSFLTRLFSYFIFITEYAREMVTARGSPSGIATTTIVIAIMKKWTNSLKKAPITNGPELSLVWM